MHGKGTEGNVLSNSRCSEVVRYASGFEDDKGSEKRQTASASGLVLRCYKDARVHNARNQRQVVRNTDRARKKTRNKKKHELVRLAQFYGREHRFKKTNKVIEQIALKL